MKKFAILLLFLSVGLFTIGCGPGGVGSNSEPKYGNPRTGEGIDKEKAKGKAEPPKEQPKPDATEPTK